MASVVSVARHVLHILAKDFALIGKYFSSAVWLGMCVCCPGNLCRMLGVADNGLLTRSQLPRF